MTDPITEVRAALEYVREYIFGDEGSVDHSADGSSQHIEHALAALHQVRAAVLEQAAKAAETRDLGDNSPQDVLAQEIAVAIRALAGRPADPT